MKTLQHSRVLKYLLNYLDLRNLLIRSTSSFPFSKRSRNFGTTLKTGTAFEILSYSVVFTLAFGASLSWLLFERACAFPYASKIPCVTASTYSL
ncbi:hypothetical protein ACOSQ3_005293 [Xanthoceras sorbifolium]